jgi:quinol monooxygenase YgiN
VTYSVGMLAVEGKADKVQETLRIDFSNVREEEGNVVSALHRSTESPDELSYCETWER